MSCRSIRRFASLLLMQRSNPASSRCVVTQHRVCARSHEWMYRSMAAAVGDRLNWSTIQELHGAGLSGESTSNFTQGISSWWYEHGILQDRPSQNYPMIRGISKAISAPPGIGSRSASARGFQYQVRLETHCCIRVKPDLPAIPPPNIRTTNGGSVMVVRSASYVSRLTSFRVHHVIS